jgi:hypothetical protein
LPRPAAIYRYIHCGATSDVFSVHAGTCAHSMYPMISGVDSCTGNVSKITLQTKSTGREHLRVKSRITVMF